VKTVTRLCTPEVLDKITANGQPYDVLVGVSDIEKNDVIVYEDPEGRKTARYADNIAYGHELNLHIAEGSEQDFTIMGLNASPASVLEALFASGSIMIGIGMEIHEKQPYLIHETQYLPVLACEPIDPTVLLETLKIENWPDGCFSILFLAKAMDVSTGRPVLQITDYTVMSLTQMQGADVFVEVDQRLLRAGKIRDRFGRYLEPYFGDPHARQNDEELDKATVDEIGEIIAGDDQ